MAKKKYILLAICICISATAQARIFYDIDFSSPEHLVGQTPTTGMRVTQPSSIVFGRPEVVAGYGQMTDQPLVFNSEGNSGALYYDQIRLSMDRGYGFYYTAFDILIHNLTGSRNQFRLLYDLPWVHNITFQNEGTVDLFGHGDISFQEDQAMHFEILMDMPRNSAKVVVNGECVYDGRLKVYSSYPDGFFMRSLRFSHGLLYGIGGPDTTSYVALDNIIVADYVVPEPCTLLLLALGTIALRSRGR